MAANLEIFIGRWDTLTGQRLRVMKMPGLGLTAIFRGGKSIRPRVLFPCYIDGFNLMVPLGWLGPLDAMLALAPGTKIEGRVPILVPEVETGPESAWEREDFGFPWVFPLAVYRRVDR